MTSSGRDGDTEVVAVPRPPDPAAGTPYLIVHRGRSAGELLSLNRPSYTVGRAEDADFHVDDDGISRHHARITVDAGVVTIEDLRSTNGTRVNNQVLEQACPLLDGDKISIGATTILKFTCHGALQPTVKHAHRGPLTQAYREEYFLEHLRAEVSFSRRHHTALSLIVFDIDQFAPLRDRVGVETADRIVAEVARAAAALVANQHLFARVGTRSFAILSRTPTAGQARDLAERVRQDVAGVPFTVGGDFVDVTISAGVAALPVEGIDTPLAFTRLADYALRDAKARGRNCVARMRRVLAAVGCTARTWSPSVGVKVLRSRIGGGGVIDNQLPEVVPGNLQLCCSSRPSAGARAREVVPRPRLVEGFDALFEESASGSCSRPGSNVGRQRDPCLSLVAHTQPCRPLPPTWPVHHTSEA